MIIYWVDGVPAPQGSKTGRVVNGKVVMWEASAKVKPWRDAVKAQTIWIMKQGNYQKLDTPVEITLVFHLPKPKTVNRTWPSVKPDLDKLVRSTLDGLTMGGIYVDDAQVIAISASKIYAQDGATGCQIFVGEA